MMISTYAMKRAAPMNQHDRDNEIFLIDGSGFIFRAYHALPPLNRPDGTPVNAVLGFTNMLVKLLNDMNAPNIAVIFDASYRFTHPVAIQHDADVPRDLLDARLGAVIQSIQRSLRTGTF